jgi:hypothetical protein
LQQPHQHVQIRKQGFADVVVWNPGNAAAGLSDLESGGNSACYAWKPPPFCNRYIWPQVPARKSDIDSQRAVGVKIG